MRAKRAPNAKRKHRQSGQRSARERATRASGRRGASPGGAQPAAARAAHTRRMALAETMREEAVGVAVEEREMAKEAKEAKEAKAEAEADMWGGGGGQR